jgi:predicted O-methyltransferase YrrM
MFKPQQGISTYLIPSYLRSTGRDASFVSIEKDKTHVEAATRMIDEVDPTLNDHIEFMQGHSLEMLPRAIEQLPSIDFALLDGGAHPEVCLQEFEMVLGRLSD